MGRRRKSDVNLAGLLILAVIVAVFQAATEHPLAFGLIVIVLIFAGIVAWQGKVRRETEARERMLGASLAELDQMSGREFEAWICAVLEADGIRAENVKHSGDFGVDVLAGIDGFRIGIQAKRYSSGVGNDAVQQALGGSGYHGCSAAAVVTQSRFTRAARAQASRAHMPIALIGRQQLGDMSALLRALARR